MQVEQVYRTIKEIELVIKNNDLQADINVRLNFYGDEFHIYVSTSEPYDSNGNWHSERCFGGRLDEADSLLSEAMKWAYSIPNAEKRASEMMIKTLIEMAEKLPKGGTELVAEAWAEIHRMLVKRAEVISKNGLMSPDRIAQLDGRTLYVP